MNMTFNNSRILVVRLIIFVALATILSACSESKSADNDSNSLTEAWDDASGFLHRKVFLPSKEEINQQLDQTAQDDLRYIIGDHIVKSGTQEHILKKPYYIIDSMSYFEGKGNAVPKFLAVAHISFHYFEKMPFHRLRSYRYNTQKRAWVRFYKAFTRGK